VESLEKKKKNYTTIKKRDDTSFIFIFVFLIDTALNFDI